MHSLHFIVLGGHTGHKTVHYLINLHLIVHMMSVVMLTATVAASLQRYSKVGVSFMEHCDRR